MKISRRLTVILGLFVLAALATGGSARPSGGPFYLVPAPTNECHAVKNCVGVVASWVLLPAHTEASFLLGCPERHGFIIGGTDSRASSPDVHVWFDGTLGAPIGFPPSSVKLGAVLLFHARAESGRQGWFQPTIGCVSLTSKTKRSTVSAVTTAPGTPAGSALDLHAENIFLRPERGVGVQKRILRCPRGETPVGSWGAVAIDTASPPASVYAHAATVNTLVVGNRVHARFHLNREFGPLAPRISVQIGVMCQA